MKGVDGGCYCVKKEKQLTKSRKIDNLMLGVLKSEYVL